MEFALVNSRVFMVMEKLDWIFNRHNVVVLSFIDQIDDGRECRALSAARRSCYQYDPVLDVYDLFELFGQVEVAKLRRVHRDDSHHDRMSAALLENVNSKASITGYAEREIG